MNLPPPSGQPLGSAPQRDRAHPDRSSDSAGSKYTSWPLWAKIAAPGAALFVGLGAIGAATAPPEAADAEVPSSIAEFAALPETTPVATTPSTTVETTVPPTTVAPTTAPPTTAPPTTAAPTTAPPTTAAPTLPPTTPAPTLPPTTPAPTLPPTTAPPPPPPVAVAALDPDYGTCKEAKAHGAGPYYQGQDPEYSWYRDADSDGIVCE